MTKLGSNMTHKVSHMSGLSLPCSSGCSNAPPRASSLASACTCSEYWFAQIVVRQGRCLSDQIFCFVECVILCLRPVEWYTILGEISKRFDDCRQMVAERQEIVHHSSES